MSTARLDLGSTGTASVRELVTRRLSDIDRWNLALVQRAEVWDELRMRHLLDSLLADYPIGAILLSTVRQQARELVVQVDGKREEVEAVAGSWQVLDGQQRINALFSIFTERGNYGRFLLNMLMARPAPTPAQARSAKERALPHIRHINEVDAELESRDRYIDLSNWAQWTSRHQDLEAPHVDASTVGALLADLDGAFRKDLSAHEADTAADNLRRLLRAWTKRSISILRAEMDTPLDVLEVFTRINLGGVTVASADVYFAGVKTFWRDAELRIDQVLAVAPVLKTRIGALRFLSRLASRAVGHGDVLPMSVDRLTGRKGELLRTALAEITEPESLVRGRLSKFVSWYTKSSQLGYVLHQVTHELWDDVLAWAVSSAQSDEAWYEQNRTLLDAYMLGATLFGYRSVMGDAFHRVALSEALEAASRGDEFPLAQIVAVTRAKTELRGSRGRRVRSLDDPSELANRHGWLLTALAQRIPYSWGPEENFDWDHIFPRAQAHRMWLPGQGGRRRHHPHRHLVNATGNFWALTSSANRSLKDMVGREKFDQLRSWLEKGDGWRIWGEDRWSITPEEIDNFIAVDEKLNGDPQSIDEAMRIFHDTVTRRSSRLLDDALKRFPEAKLFANELDGPKHDPSPVGQDYRRELGISAGDADLLLVDSDDARRRLRQRADLLLARIVDALDGRCARSWPWASRGRSPLEQAYAAFELVDGNCIELMLKWEASRGAYIEVKAYKGRPHKRNLYPDFDHIPFGLPWSASDDQIVKRFLAETRRLQEVHPRP